MQIEPFEPTLDPAALVELRRRLSVARLPAPRRPDWQQGMPAQWLVRLVDDWLAFDVVAFQAELQKLPHLTADVAGQRIHLVHVPGHGPDPMPLLLTHGWPGSFLEYLPVISQLTDPQAHGGDPGDSFSVVIPSLPGFGFSAPPPADGYGAESVASLWHQLMTEGLGYERYAAHGSDLGAGITAGLARAHPQHVAGIHLASPGLPRPRASAPPMTAAETAYFTAGTTWAAEEGGYAHEHSTKPATLAAALADSPVGIAAWIGEKVAAWSPVRENDQPAFDHALLLGTLTLYWATDTIASSLLPYWAGRHLPVASLADTEPVSVPTAISIFRGERVPFPQPPQELGARYFRLARWAEHDRGGHFPSVAEPELLVSTLREAFRPLRTA